MISLSSVYWIHLPEHTDITCEGYIGITDKTPDDRFKEHVRLSENGSDITLAKAIRKYGNKLVISTLLKGDREYCLLMEYKLRPHKRIGWNILEGGKNPVVFNGPHTEESKLKISKASKESCNSEAHKKARAARVGTKRSEETKAKLCEKAKDRLPWETSRANKDIWCVADVIYMHHKENPKMGYINLEKLLGYSKYELQNMYLKFSKHNWDPLQDLNWLEWTQKFNIK